MKIEPTQLDPGMPVPTPPPVVVNPDLPVAITDEEADAAAKSLGMKFFKAGKTRQLRKIGMFITQQGVVQMGVGRLAACEEALQTMIDTAVEISSSPTEESDTRVSALIAGKGLVEVMQKGIQMEAEFQQEKLIGGPAPTRKRSFETDAPIVPIQVQSGATLNITVDEKKP